MAATAQNGREYLLLELLPKIQDDKLWEVVTRDLFEQKDRHHLWRLEIYDRFAELTEDELDKNSCNWTIAGTDWLQQIALDIRFATSLFCPSDWDPHILQDFINVLSLTLQLFQGKKECLGKVKEHCRNLKTSDEPKINKAQDAAKEFDKWRRYVNNSFRTLVNSLDYHECRNGDGHNQCMKVQEGDKVSGATLTELLIRNEIQRQRSRIVSRPVEIIQEDTKHVSRVDPKDATEVISGILANFENVYRKTREDFEKEITQEEIAQNKVKVAVSQHWHSRMIAVVADADTGIIVTGATKPVAPDIPIFQDAADNISHIRVGESFGSIIGNCSKDVWKLVRGIRKKLNEVPLTDPNSLSVTKESAGLYDAVVNAEKDPVANYQNIPSSKNGIMSWAFGSDFKFRRPCTRCQRLYSGWVLHEMPDTPGKMLAGLRQDHWTGSLKYTSGYKYPCGYCAETAAAAKLYALYYGTLTLVLSKDTDKIRASDKVRTDNEARAPG